MPLGDFLVAYLQKLGVTHLFGIPGDLVLRLFFRLAVRRGLRVVTLSHEPATGFTMLCPPAPYVTHATPMRPVARA